MVRSILTRLAGFLARHPKMAIAGAIFYLLTPVDAVPEMLVGPVGYLDDLFVILMTIWAQQLARNIKNKPSSRPDVIDTTARED